MTIRVFDQNGVEVVAGLTSLPIPESNVTGLVADLAAKCSSTDSRLSDARTPTAHATTHKSGGTDSIKLNELAAPTADVGLNSHKLTSVADPSSAQDAATKAYVDAHAGGGGSSAGSSGDVQVSDGAGGFVGSGTLNYDGGGLLSFSDTFTPTINFTQSSADAGNFYCGFFFNNASGLFGACTALSTNYHDSAQTQLLSGTITDDGSGNITGVGSAFLTEVKIGDWVFSDDSGPFGGVILGGFVSAIADDFNMTLTATCGATATASRVNGVYYPDTTAFTSFGDYSSLTFVQRGVNGHIAFAVGNYNPDSNIKLWIDGVSGNVFVGAIKDDGSGALLQVNGGISTQGSAGVSGTFTTADSKTVTVTNGLITSIV